MLMLVACGTIPRPTYPQTDAATALARREATTAGLLSIRAEARVDQRGRQGRVRGTVLMFIERAGRVRFDVMTQFGPIAILTSDRQRFAFADLREGRYLTGATCPQNIARLLGVPLSVDETSRFLLAGTSLIDYQKSQVSWNADGFYRLSLLSVAGERQELDLGIYPQDVKLPAAQQRLYLLRSERWSAAGKSEWRVTYTDHKAVRLGGAQVLVPFRVRVEQARSASDTLVHFKDVAFNPQIPEGAFTQSPRPGMQQEEASCE
jgi:outer membrane lipoprotein-sorting protein